MKTKNMLAVTFSCLLASSAWAALENTDSQLILAGNTDAHDTPPHSSGYDSDDTTHQPQDKSILDHENREDAKDLGTGTDATDAQTEGSGTTSESIPDNIPPARAR